MKIGLVAGEASGDLLGAGLIRAIRERLPEAEFEGVAGPAMAAAGCEVLADADTLAVMGLVEPLRVLPKLLRLRRTLAERWIAAPPDVFVGIDAPDFNLGLEARLRAAGIATAHYVSPSVWAWREGRVRKIRKAVDCVLCILPFETAFYARHGVRAEFVGHPRADAPPRFADMQAARQHLGLPADGTVVAVLPGSRKSEVSQLAADFADAAALLQKRYPGLRFVTPVARPGLRPLIEAELERARIREAFLLVDGESEAAMSAADVVLLASGTAALEAALLCKPTVAAYRLAATTAFLFRLFGLLKIDKFTLPNLLTKEPQVPEFIQEDLTPDALTEAVSEFLDDPERRASVRDRFATLRTELALDADQRAADVVVSLASGQG